MAADLSHVTEESYFMNFSSLTMTRWQMLFWNCVPVGFTGGVVGSLYKMVWGLQIPARKLAFGSMFSEWWQGARIIFPGLSGIQAYPTFQLVGQ